MIALVDTQSQQPRRRTPSQRITGYVMALDRRRRSLEDLTIIYRDQPAILPLQAAATIDRLIEARRVVLAALAYHQGLTPAETERIRPYACIAKLEALDYHCTQTILNVAMFAQVCQSVDPERPRLHLEIRAALPILLRWYDDATAMLAALVDKAREEGGRA